jgi:N5-(carboxyethyl)ornithine synthase
MEQRMRTVGFPIPGKEQELRRALVPADLPLVRDPSALLFEGGYGAPLGLDDAAYEAEGARVAGRADVDACPVICDPKPVVGAGYFGPGKTLFGWIHAVQGRTMTDLLIGHRMTAIAWEDMFEGERHCFWRNNELAGEAAVAHAFLQWGRVPYNCEVAVIGTGNVAMGAIRAAERGGCTVKVYDALTSHRLRGEIERYGVIVNAVLWDVTRTDHVVSEEDLVRMQPGSLIVDVSCDEAGAIETSRPTTVADPVYVHKGIVHYAVDHTPSLYHRTATESISAVVARFISDVAEGRANPVLEKATIIREGHILDERINKFQGRT